MTTINEFLFVLIKKNGKVLYNVFATSHADLVGKYITDNDSKDDYFKATFTPKEGCRFDDVNNYHLLINEQFIPEWFTQSKRRTIIKQLKSIIETLIINGRKKSPIR